MKRNETNITVASSVWKEPTQAEIEAKIDELLEHGDDAAQYRELVASHGGDKWVLEDQARMLLIVRGREN